MEVWQAAAIVAWLMVITFGIIMVAGGSQRDDLCVSCGVPMVNGYYAVRVVGNGKVVKFCQDCATVRGLGPWYEKPKS